MKDHYTYGVILVASREKPIFTQAFVLVRCLEWAVNQSDVSDNTTTKYALSDFDRLTYPHPGDE